MFEWDAIGLIRFNDLCYAKLKVLSPDAEIGWMDSKTAKLNCFTLGELKNEPISKNNPLNVPLK